MFGKRHNPCWQLVQYLLQLVFEPVGGLGIYVGEQCELRSQQVGEVLDRRCLREEDAKRLFEYIQHIRRHCVSNQ
ncbi:hypothetical protein EDB89DRAFT_2015900 [Lactarius sanguifluus]|nr:hypothetical protein EDB89DRAFT_2015900 [Lactarius sanguifluus]